MGDDEEKQQALNKLEQELGVRALVAMRQKTMVDLTKTCFERCIGTPGNSMSTNEQRCIFNCTARLLETDHFISRRTMEMANKIAGQMQGGGGGGGGGTD
eukprot:GHVU01072665.1.p5 GENE.GHVU01072665.1~~GHVU01072665.1.p5  ORF type:complete len:100 (-),score=22.00 GHVU01072665.1:2732-3031(-)